MLWWPWSDAFTNAVERRDAQHAECRGRRILPGRRQPIDRNWPVAHALKRALKRRDRGLAPLGFDPAGQGHVKPEIGKQIGITPAVEVLDLAWIESGGQ